MCHLSVYMGDDDDKIMKHPNSPLFFGDYFACMYPSTINGFYVLGQKLLKACVEQRLAHQAVHS